MKISKKIPAISLCVFLCASSGLVLSSENTLNKFKDFDKNKDGMIDANEFIEIQNKKIKQHEKEGLSEIYDPINFFKFDVNRDNKISPEEFAQAQVNANFEDTHEYP